MILVIGGATATGKSDLAVKAALRFHGEIVSADSMQIYKGMDVGTAKITEEEMCGIPHYMIDIISPTEPYNVSMYVENAEKIIENIQKRNKLPIVVGGTGLYIRSLLYNYKMGAFDEKVREELTQEYKEKGEEYMWQKLAASDEKGAKRIHKNNVKRVLRALEVVCLTGKSIFEQEGTEEAKEHVMVCLKTERAKLYERIDKRVDVMFEKGVKEEVERLLQEGVTFDCQSMQAIGYKEFKSYFEGVKTLEEVKEEIKLNTRHYAKRQETWFRSMPTAKWYEIEQKNKIIDELEQIITK